MEGTKTAVASLVTGLEFALARSFEVPAGRHRQDIKLRRLHSLQNHGAFCLNLDLAVSDQ
jgi:hypothetical protein